MRCSGIRLLWCVALLVVASAARAEPISRIVVFGDSLSDSGNVFVGTGGVLPAPPYFNGRFSNGPVWVERMAEKLGLPAPAPSLTGGYDYAFGGAETGPGWSSSGTPNLLTQLGMYRLAHAPAASDLFVVWGGANDIFVGIGGPTPPNVSAYAVNLSTAITTLAMAGGKQFLVPNLPPLGQTPSLRGTGYEAEGDSLTAQFNTALLTELSQLRTTLGVTIYGLDTHALLTQAIADPGKFGLTNVTDPAFDAATGNVVANPQEYMFWDGEHPTAAVHSLLGEYAAAAVPEPSALAAWLSGAVTAVLLVLRRRL